MDAYPDRDFVFIRGRPIRHQVAVRDWVCGLCEGALVTRPQVDEDNRRCTWHTVCGRDEGHPPDRFVHHETLTRRIHAEMTQAGNLRLACTRSLTGAERRTNMALKDRDTAYGVPKRMRLGRIGRVRQGILATSSSGKKYPKAVKHFILDPLTDNDEEREAILAGARSAVEEHAPGQDLERPTVLPIVFLAGNDDIIAPESYKVRKGRQGTVWCAGDGETIHWKLTDDFRVEIAGGAHAETGELVPCPGRCLDDRHPWCQPCKAELEINFAILGYERTGVWMLRTSSMTFRDQFWTQIGMVRAMAQRGIVPGLVGVPFLLRRQVEAVLSPVGDNGNLATVDMPITSIEIDPEWFKEVMRQNREAPWVVPRLAAGEAAPPDGIALHPHEMDVPAPAPEAHAEPDPGPPPDPEPPGSGETHAAANPAPLVTSPTNGRPLSAASLRSLVRYKAGWKIGQEGDYSDAHRLVEGEPITPAQIGALAGLLSEAVKERGLTQKLLDKARYDVMDYLLGVRSTSGLFKREAHALIAWLALSADNAKDLHVHARAEARAVMAVVAAEAGQMALPVFEEGPEEQVAVQDVAPPADEYQEDLPF